MTSFIFSDSRGYSLVAILRQAGLVHLTYWQSMCKGCQKSVYHSLHLLLTHIHKYMRKNTEYTVVYCFAYYLLVFHRHTQYLPRAVR